MQWYNTDKLDKYAKDARIAFIVGERRIGKTLHFQKKAFDNWYNRGESTMWLRNKKVELQDPSFSADFLNAPLKFDWCDPNVVCFPDGVYTDKRKTEQIIKFQSISTASNRRGNMSDNTTMMVLDEFMPEDRRFPKHAPKMLMSLTKTVFSGNPDAKVYCLSNFISSANPYFVGFRIYPSKRLDVTYFPDKAIAIEVCRGYKTAIEDDNPWNRVYRAGGYQDYASAEEDTLFQLIKPVPPNGIREPFFIKSDNVYYSMVYRDGLIYWHEYNGERGLTFTPNLSETSDKVSLIPRFLRRDIKQWSEDNIMRFSNPNVMYAILSIIYDAV